MSSFKGKSKYMDNVNIADGYKHIHPSRKHYRPQHYRINKEMQKFDNDIMWVCIETETHTIDLDFGINQTLWKAHDSDGFDDYKNGN